MWRQALSWQAGHMGVLGKPSHAHAHVSRGSHTPLLLCTGDHTRSILVSTPTGASGGIMRFAKVRLSCLGCKAPLDKPAGEGGTPLCKHCLPK